MTDVRIDIDAQTTNTYIQMKSSTRESSSDIESSEGIVGIVP